MSGMVPSFCEYILLPQSFLNDNSYKQVDTFRHVGTKIKQTKPSLKSLELTEHSKQDEMAANSKMGNYMTSKPKWKGYKK